MTMLDAALIYAQHGDPVFPVWWIENGRCACPVTECTDNAGKHPIPKCAPNGLKNATTDEETLRRWWTLYPKANVAMRTGITRTVLDVDPDKGGRVTLAALETAHGSLPVTPKVHTGGGGDHYHLAPVPGVGNSAGKLGPGLDVRGEDGYVLMPPSTHVRGIYADDANAPLYDTPLAEAPTWLVTLLVQPQVPHEDPVERQSSAAWEEKLRGVPVGQRRTVALEIAGHFLELLGPARRGEVEEILLGFAARCAPPFPEPEARALVRDLAQRDLTRAEAAPVTSPGGPVALLGLPADEFLAQEFPVSEPYVDGILSSDGGGWIVGEEKLGKSFYAVEEALCLALGVPVCQRFAVPHARRVLFIEEEDAPRRVHTRLRALLRGHGYPPEDPDVLRALHRQLRISVWEGVSLDDPAMLARLEATIVDFRPAVCYLDVLRKLTTKDLNKAAEASVLLGALDRLRRTHGCSSASCITTASNRASAPAAGRRR